MSRSNARSRRLRRRPSRTIPATIVAAVLLVVGALAVTVGITRLVKGTWPSQASGPARTIADLTWGSAAIVAAGVVIALLGLMLLVVGLKLGALKTARLRPATADTGVSDTDFVISTRAMAHLAASRANQVDGVDKVSASASARRVRVRVLTTSEQTTEIRDRVSQDVTQTLSAAGVHPMPRVAIAVRTKGI